MEDNGGVGEEDGDVEEGKSVGTSGESLWKLEGGKELVVLLLRAEKYICY